MKIRKIETFKVQPRWCFLKITTESGITGWGEPVIEGKADTVETAVHEMADYIIGKSAENIEDIFQTLYRGAFYRGGPILSSAMSGIDQALWDIKGKAHQMPVYDFFGGPVKDKMRVYCWIGGDRPADTAWAAMEKYEQGYSAVKMNATPEIAWIDNYKVVEDVLERVGSIRDKLGYKMDIALDFHGRVHKGMAKVLMKELEQFHPMFVEEPVLCENEEAFRELKSCTSIPVDLSHAGGISEVRRIAAMAEAYDIAVAPHCPLGPVALASCLQLDFCTQNAFIQEQSLGIHYNEGSDLLDYLVDKSVFEYQDGYVLRPKLPGLGIEVNEEKVRKMAENWKAWRNPVWRTQDGNVAEW